LFAGFGFVDNKTHVCVVHILKSPFPEHFQDYLILINKRKYQA